MGNEMTLEAAHDGTGHVRIAVTLPRRARDPDLGQPGTCSPSKPASSGANSPAQPAASSAGTPVRERQDHPPGHRHHHSDGNGGDGGGG